MMNNNFSTPQALTHHAVDRKTNRLNGLVTDSMASFAAHVASVVSPSKYYVELVRFEHEIHLDCHGNINGDAVVAVIRNNQVVTFMLAKSWKVSTYFSDGKYVIQ